MAMGVTIPFALLAALERKNKYFRVGGAIAAGVAFLVTLDTFEDERQKLKERNNGT